MNRRFPDVGPALILAAAMLGGTALAVAAPHGSWTAVGGPLLLALAVVGTDVAWRRRSGLGSGPSAGALVVAASILVACGIVGFRDSARIAEMMPLLGSCAAAPFILRRKGARTSCLAAARGRQQP